MPARARPTFFSADAIRMSIHRRRCPGSHVIPAQCIDLERRLPATKAMF